MDTLSTWVAQNPEPLQQVGIALGTVIAVVGGQKGFFWLKNLFLSATENRIGELERWIENLQIEIEKLKRELDGKS